MAFLPPVLRNDLMLMDIFIFIQIIMVPFIVILAGLMTLMVQTSVHCEKFLEEQIMILIFLIVTVFFVGCLGIYQRSTWLLCVFFILILVLIGTLFQFSISLWKFSNGDDVGEAYDNWNKVKTCLQANEVCDTTVDKADLTMFQYNLRRTPYVKYGCCNPTQCFDCETCKAGYLANLKKVWMSYSRTNIICLVFSSIIYFAGCCYLIMNSRKDSED